MSAGQNSFKAPQISQDWLPARCSGVEFRPCVSLQLMFSGEQSFWTRARQPFFAASSRAASPLNKSWMSVSPSLTMSSGMLPSRFFLVGSAPCYTNTLLWESKAENIYTRTPPNRASPSAAVCRFHICLWLQPHEGVWTSTNLPHSLKLHVWPAVQLPHSDRRSTHCEEEQDRCRRSSTWAGIHPISPF